MHHTFDGRWSPCSLELEEGGAEPYLDVALAVDCDPGGMVWGKDSDQARIHKWPAPHEAFAEAWHCLTSQQPHGDSLVHEAGRQILYTKERSH